MKSTRKRQNPKKKTEEKKNETNGYQKRTKKKGRQREEREENNKTQTCSFWSTHIGIGVSCLLSNFLIDLGEKIGGFEEKKLKLYQFFLLKLIKLNTRKINFFSTFPSPKNHHNQTWL